MVKNRFKGKKSRRLRWFGKKYKSGPYRTASSYSDDQHYYDGAKGYKRVPRHIYLQNRLKKRKRRR